MLRCSSCWIEPIADGTAYCVQCHLLAKIRIYGRSPPGKPRDWSYTPLPTRPFTGSPSDDPEGMLRSLRNKRSGCGMRNSFGF